MTLTEYAEKIEPLDREMMQQAEKRWDTIAKPLKSLGFLEGIVTKIVGITRRDTVDISKRALIVMCADNGVVAEGVTQTGSEVTAIVADNMTKNGSTVTVMCRAAEVDVFPVDIGMLTEGECFDVAEWDGASPVSLKEDKTALSPRTLVHRKIDYGTKNMAKGPAMTREQAESAVLAGIDLVRQLKEQGYQIIATGEMGIGNTTSSSAMASVLLDRPVEDVTGKGAGLSDAGLERKIAVIKKAIELNRPDAEDALDVLTKVGGFDIAGMAGVFLGGAVYHVPIVIDGFISSVAALTASRICPTAADYMLASHVSKEPAGRMVLDAMNLTPILYADMHLGEGTGAVAAIPVFHMGCCVYSQMGTFDDIQVEQYVPL